MVVLFIKNWFKSWAFWVWLLFISLLASDSESVPRLQSAEEKEKIKKKKIIKKIIKVKKVKEDERENENKEENVQIVNESPEILVKEDDAFIVDETNNEEISIKEDIFLENEVESDNKIDETDLETDDAGSKLRVEENAADESGELSDNRDEDEDDVHWIDVGRGTGLARYCGLQNLLDAEESNEKLLIVERRTPPLAVIPRREGGPLTLQRGMIIKSLSQEKDRLEEIPEEERQPSPRPGEQPLDNSDKIWAQLVARYSEESEKIQKIENRILLMDQTGKVTQQKAKDFTEENMTSREFSEEVGKRLQLYLEKVEENAENDINADDDGTQEIEGDVIEDIDLLEDGKHKIFIMIEDDESNEDRDEIPIPDEFNISNSDLEIEGICEPKEQMNDDDMLIIVDAEDTVEGKEADVKASNQENETSFEAENELVVYEPENMEVTSKFPKSLNVEQVNEEERVNDFTNQDIDDENVLPLLIKEEICSVGITDEFKKDSFNDKINIEESSIEVKEESIVEIKESESNVEDTPVFTVTVKRKSKSVNADDSGIEDVSCMSDSVTENIFHEPKYVVADIPAVQEQVSDVISAHLERDTDDVPEVSFVLPDKKKHDVVKEKFETDEDTEGSNSEIIFQNVKESQLKDKDLCSSLPKISYKDEETNVKDFRRSLPSLSEDIFRNSEENLMKLKLGNERRSSRDLWKMECEKLLEESDRVGINTLEEEKGEDIFITRYEEFPEDYITHEEINDDAAPDKPSFTSLQELCDVSVNTQLLLESIQDESLNVDEKDNSNIITMDSDFEIVMPSDVTDKEIVDSSLQITEDFIDNSQTVLSEKLDQCNKACYSEDHVDSEDVEISAKKLKDDELSESACEVVSGKERLDSQSESIPDSTQLFNVSDILTHSEQNLVARILAQKEEFEELSTETDDNFENEASSKEMEDTNLYVSDSLQDLASKDVLMVEDEQFNELTKDKENLFDDKDKLDDVNDTIKSMETEDKLADVEDVPDTNLSLKATGLDDSKSAKDSLTEKEIILELIRKERDPNSKEIIDESEVPDYLEDVKDLLVPRARRKKVKRRYDALSEILKVDESEYLPSKSTTLTENLNVENLLVDEDRASGFFRELTPENTGAISSKQDEFLLTEEEQKELEDIKKEQEAYRAVQRKELEKFLAMPSALTEQEQRELEEFLAQEETDKVAIAGSEARLEALLADVRRRLTESGMDLGDENMDQYMSLPVELTEEEENLLNEDEEKGRHDFETDEDYREYIKQRYLDELEEDRIRVEEEELEFGEYYDDEYDYEDEDYGAEYVESDYVVMNEDDEAKATLKDEAVGSDEPMEFEDNKGKKEKKFFSIPGLRSRGSSRGSRASLDKPGSKDSSREGSVSGEAKEQQNKQTKKFFRFGSLSIKRKKKSNEYPECDPNFKVNNDYEDNVNAFLDFRGEKHVPDNEFKSNNIFNIMSILFIQTNGDSVVADIIRKKRMILLLKCLQKHNKYVEADSNTMRKFYIKNNEIGVDEWNNNINNNDIEIGIKIRNQLNNPLEFLNRFASIKNASCIENESSTCGVNNNEISPVDTKQSDLILLPLHEGNDWEVLERDDSKNPIISLVEGFVLVSEKHRDSTLPLNKDVVLSNAMNSNMEMNNGVNSGCPVPSEVSVFKDTAMSGEGGGLATSSANGVSVIDDDSLECASDVSSDVQSAASNTSLGVQLFPKPVESQQITMDKQPSLQELIEAELTARFAPLQPDSLESLLEKDFNEPTIFNGGDATTTLLDSLEAPPFSLDSLADAESGVDLTSPHNPNSGENSPVPSPSQIPVSDDSSNFDNYNVNHINAQHPTQIPIIDTGVITSDVYADHDHSYSQIQSSQLIESVEPGVPNDLDNNIQIIDPSWSSHDSHNETHEINNDVEKDLCDNAFESENIILSNNVSCDDNLVNNTINMNLSQKFEDSDGEKVCNENGNGVNETEKLIDTEQKSNQEEEVSVVEGYLRMNQPNGIEITLEEKQENIQIYESSEICVQSSENSVLITTEKTSELASDVSSLEKTSTSVLEIGSDSEISMTHENVELLNGNHEIHSENIQSVHVENSQTENGDIDNPATENLSEDVSVLNGSEPNLENDCEHEIANNASVNKIESNGQTGIINGHLDQRENDNDLEVNNKLTNGHTEHLKPSDTKSNPDPLAKKIDVTNSYNIISIAKSSETFVAKSSALHSDNVTNGVSEEEELWPEDSKDGDEGDEFDRMEKEVIIEMEKENLEKKKKREGDKKGKKKRKKKGDSEKENKKTVYQTKEELYEKHVGPRIRSFDAAKMKTKFNKPKEPTQVSTDCRICGKQVFQMEKIVAEKASWHKNCFRCKECNKNLTLETYQSHEGTLYCKPHFKELFRPKAVIQDEAAERKDRQLRRPRMIVLESNPEALPDDVVRATSKPDYGLEELQQQTLNVKERFAVFENLSKEEEKPRPEPVSVRRSQSLMSKAARFLDGQEDGEFNDEEEEEEEDEEEEGEDEEGEEVVDGENEGEPVVKSRNKKKKERPMSFSGMGDLKAAWEQKQRREEMSQSRKEEITRFRQMLCAGKNMSLKEKFESGNFDDHENGEANPPKEEIKIEGKRAASNLKKRFEQGEPFILEDDDEEGEDDEGRPKRRDRIISEKHEVEEIFKEAETAKKARNVFKQIDSKVAKEGTAILRSQSFASNRENRHSMDASVLMHPPVPTGEVVKSDVKVEDYSVDTTDLACRFKFFLNYEKDKEREKEKSRKVFRITPPREGIDQVEEVDFSKAKMPKPCMAVNCAVCKLRRIQGPDDADMLGRDPNLIKCTDNYQDDVDCRNTRNILQMFKKMEMGEDEEEEEEGPKPLKRFTPPPGAEENDEESDEEYSDDEYSDEEEGEEEEGEADNAAKVRDELLQMLSARKAASLRAKFERWEAEVDQQNDMNKDKDDVEEGMPSLDTAKNLKAMFEHKAIEVAKPVASKPITQKVNRFVGGGGEKCVSCDKTVYVMEKLDIHGKVLHKHCFKCFKCNTQLSVGSFSFGGGNNMFCSTHYKQLFTEKGGSYDAFTEEKGKWTKKIEEMNGEIKSHD